MSDSQSIRRPFAVLAWVLLAVGLLLLLLSLVIYPISIDARVVVLAVLILLAENYALAMPGYGVSVTYPMAFAMALVAGPAATLVAVLGVCVNLQEIRMRLPPAVYAFNTGQILITNALAAWSYVLLGGRVLGSSSGVYAPFSSGDLPQLILPIAAMIALGVLGNFSLLAVGYSLKHGVKLREVLAALGWLPPVQIALAGVGILLAQVLAGANGVAALPLFIFPLFVARQFYQRFMALQAAYTETLRSLVTGLEAKDPYTRGHSERVAQYAVVLARACGLGDRDVHEIETAALLHDLGKLSVGGAILRKPGKLDEAEWKAMKLHPEAGSSMVRRIPHLRSLADAVSAHHERLDGSGYPQGLRGEEISMQARLLAIADSFDAMTTDRPYRPGFSHEAAVEELRSCSGRLYDVELVEVFAAAILKGNRGSIGYETKAAGSGSVKEAKAL